MYLAFIGALIYLLIGIYLTRYGGFKAGNPETQFYFDNYIPFANTLMKVMTVFFWIFIIRFDFGEEK